MPCVSEPQGWILLGKHGALAAALTEHRERHLPIQDSLFPSSLLTTFLEGQVPPLHTLTTLPHLPYKTGVSSLFTMKPEIYSYAPAQAPGKADYYFQQGVQYFDIMT